MNNQITVIGHVGQAPTSKLFDDTGNKVVKFSVAVKEYSANNEEDKTMWIDVDAWNGLGERILSTVTQGREVSLTGRLAISKYTKEVNGTKVKMMKPVIKLTGFHLCGKKPESENETPPVEKPAKTRKLAAVNS
jgi:single stranded DNA-binding protein